MCPSPKTTTTTNESESDKTAWMVGWWSKKRTIRAINKSWERERLSTQIRSHISEIGHQQQVTISLRAIFTCCVQTAATTTVNAVGSEQDSVRSGCTSLRQDVRMSESHNPQSQKAEIILFCAIADFVQSQGQCPASPDEREA